MFGTSNNFVGTWMIDAEYIINALTWRAGGPVSYIKVINGSILLAAVETQLRVFNIVPNVNFTNPPILIYGGHNAKVNMFDTMANDTVVVSGDANGKLLVWSPLTNSTLVSQPNAHSASILCVKTIPNTITIGKSKSSGTIGQFASGAASSDNTIILWSFNSVSVTQIFPPISGHTNSVRALDVLTGGYLISASNDGTAIVWKLSDGKKGNQFNAVNSAQVSCLELLPNGNVAFGGNDSSIYIWKNVDSNLVFGGLFQ